MANEASNTIRSSERPEIRRSHRTRVLTTLFEICRGLERMQEVAEAREACRDVARMLEELRDLEAERAIAGQRGRRGR